MRRGVNDVMRMLFKKAGVLVLKVLQGTNVVGAGVRVRNEII